MHALQERVQLRPPTWRVRGFELDRRDDPIQHGPAQSFPARNVDVEGGGSCVQGGGDPAHRDRLQTV